LEPRLKLLETINKYPLYCAKIVLIIAGLFIATNNFFDCVMGGDPLIEYIIYSGIPFISCIIMATTKSKYPLVSILALFGVLMVLDSKAPNSMTAGALFFVGAKRVANNIYFSVFIYFITAISIVGASLFYESDSKDNPNVITAYFAAYILDYLICKYMKNQIVGSVDG